MKCHVYRSSVKDGLYVYVAAAADDDGKVIDGSPGEDGLGEVDRVAIEPPGLAALPVPVRRQLGRPELAMTLELGPDRKLGQEDIAEVLANLAGQGFHVQMPRDIELDVETIARSATDAATSRAVGRAGGQGDKRGG